MSWSLAIVVILIAACADPFPPPPRHPATAAPARAPVTAEAAPPGRHLVPRKPAAETYESQPARDAPFQPFGDSLRAAVHKGVAEAGRKQGIRVVADARLDAAMSDL